MRTFLVLKFAFTVPAPWSDHLEVNRLMHLHTKCRYHLLFLRHRHITEMDVVITPPQKNSLLSIQTHGLTALTKTSILVHGQYMAIDSHNLLLPQDPWKALVLFHLSASYWYSGGIHISSTRCASKAFTTPEAVCAPMLTPMKKLEMTHQTIRTSR